MWHGKHMIIHTLLGLVWAWFLREWFGQFNFIWVTTAVVGSVIPDIDHFIYFITYGKHDSYTRMIWRFIKTHQWRVLVKYIESGHKYNTNLSFHNYYTVAGLVILEGLSFIYSWQIGVTLFGAMITHYLYDIAEDFVVLGYINSNWCRWGRDKGSR